MSNYPHLFAPIRVRNVYIKNRVESAPMSASGEVPFYTREAYEMYNSIAKGGAGIVTLGEAGVHSLTDHAHPAMPHLDDENLLPTLIQTVDTVHKWGALASIELTHSGCRAKGAFLAEGGYVIGPSPMEENLYGDKVIEMDEDMMNEIADAYAQAAYMAEFAGCDMVNIHGGHGWLISQFLSDLNNHRTDQYGGSIGNKARFPLMIVDRIRQKCPNLIIEFRLSGVEETEGGITIDETVEFAKMLDGKVDIIHVSAATFHDTGSAARMFPTVFYPRGCNVENASKIKAVVKNSLVSVVGGINDPEFMDAALAEGKADFVVVGRQFIADPDWVVKARTGRADEISKCIRCETCISAGFIPHVPFSSGVLRCSVNPTWGREYENTRKEEKPERLKKVLVAGGGPGGMEAAMTAARRGHTVILCEKSDHLAANLDYAKQISFKHDIVDFLKSMVVRIQRTPNLEIRLDTEVTEELIRAEKPDVIIAACGSEPVTPPIPGLDRPIVHHITDLYRKHLSIGKKVVVIGGGLAGCEEGLGLAWEGHDVTIVEMKDGLAKDAPYIHWRHLLTKLNESVHSYCSARVLSVEENGVKIVDAEGTEQLLEADTVLVAAGMRGTSERFDSWHELADEVIVVGDCRKASKILEAMRTGYCAGMTI
ncbi:FAD-dependent oxidoreductase [[Clostridium] symbiosum]|uniref:oxidoreductase n=1 Tax=Clostridium symbiosum TaxID=1512 RepID=UPI001D05E757|nr:FAD-dependent oxidoreductase [[Clostridium] symbiosum]MCB6608011.1 FAD-dependent oxidoreductase [[Clostridium] symbiosum]MCB6931346.1 FAD-dependent oxidoreductase [[Clostridium] symbiosum]